MKNCSSPVLVEITSFGAEGVAVGKYQDKVIFIPYAAPGDKIMVKITKKRKNYLEGVIDSFIEKSTLRTPTFCKHFGYCGGCSWQHIPYNIQLEFKTKQVEEQMRRIGKIDLTNVKQAIGSSSQQAYRNKLEFSFTSSRWLLPDEISQQQPINQRNGIGFHIPGRFDKIFDVEKCYLQPNYSNQIRLFVKQYAIDNQIDFFSPTHQTGLLRNMVVRNNQSDEWMIILVFTRFEEKIICQLLEALKTNFEKIKSLIYFINPKRNDSLADLPYTIYAGTDHLIEKIDALNFKIGPKSFFQTNTNQAKNLYSIALEMANLSGQEIVYDFYTGTGTIACFIATKAKKVIGIENVEEAIADAKLNAKLNHLENIDFYCGDMKDIFTESFMLQNGFPDVVITDPPRAGMHPDIINRLLQIMPHRIVYISCNPATQARDLSLLKSKYKIENLQPVDMFPHTHHIENIALLLKNTL